MEIEGENIHKGISIAGTTALSPRESIVEIMGTYCKSEDPSKSKGIINDRPLDCRLPLPPHLQTVMFRVKLGLMTGDLD